MVASKEWNTVVYMSTMLNGRIDSRITAEWVDGLKLRMMGWHDCQFEDNLLH